MLFSGCCQKENLILLKCNNMYLKKIRFTFVLSLMEHLTKLYFRSFIMSNDCFKKRKKKSMRKKTEGCFHLKIFL